MPSLHVSLTLESDLVLSQRSATIGGHSTLRYIPGAALLGAVASLPDGDGVLYDRLGADAFRCFHSGSVRFGCGWPVDGAGRPALPVPRSLHEEKRREAGSSKPALNLAVADRPRGVQLVQERAGFVGPGRARVSVETRYSMRTAVGRGGQAREGLLFGYEAIAAGQTFVARLDADEGEDLERLRSALVGRTIHLGRSRSAEFGRVRVEEVQAEPWPLASTADGRVVILFASDAAFRDDNGSPRLEPSPEDFGLSGWSIDWSRSFLRFRSWSPFHGVRRRPDTERQVVEAGSVLTLEPPAGDGVDGLEQARAATSRGVGEWREEGLGQVLVQPELLLGPSVELAEPDGPSDRPSAPLPADALGAWLVQRERERRLRDTAEEISSRLEEKLAWMTRGRHRIPPSQWSALQRCALRHLADRDGLLAALREQVGLTGGDRGRGGGKPRTTVGYGKDAARPDAGRGARVRRWSQRKEGQSLEKELLAACEGHSELLGPVLERLASQMAAKSRRDREEAR